MKLNCKYSLRFLYNQIILCICIVFFSACTSKLDPITLPTESAIESTHSLLWNELEIVRSDNWFHLLNDGASALEWRIRAIDSASESIDFQTFLWKLDIAGKHILNHIFMAAERGVRVRLLVDDTFLVGKDDLSHSIRGHPNVEFRVFNPYKRKADSFVTRQILNLGEFYRLDHRMHNKVMIVDNHIAIIGGRNIGDEYFGLHDTTNFRDMELLTGGPIVKTMSEGFDKYWNDHWSFPISNSDSSYSLINVSEFESWFKKESHLERKDNWVKMLESAHEGLPILLLDNPPPVDIVRWEPSNLTEKLINFIDSANEKILIVSAYLIPTKEAELAVKRAKERGVEVRILTNSIRSNNHLTAHSAYRNHIFDILTYGANLHETRIDAKDRYLYIRSPIENKKLALHAKVMTLDNEKVFIGSANFDPRSLRLNTEMGLIVHSETLAKEVNDALLLDMKPENSWSLRLTESGEVQWISDQEVLNHQPTHSFMQAIEDWFFSLLPIENKM